MDKELNALFNFETPSHHKKVHTFFLKPAYSLQFVSFETARLKSIPYKRKAEAQHRASVQGTGFCLLHELLQAVLFMMLKRARRGIWEEAKLQTAELHNQESRPRITIFLAT